jgi:2-oxoglutarate dehydrogenase E2 component (dihydrolipoamide succinyltransferase)
MKKPQTARDDDMDLAFDPVEDINDENIPDESSFDRALNQLLPEDAQGRRSGSRGLDIDLDDFEAFNRELDARLQDVRDLRPLPTRAPLVEELDDEVMEAPAPVARATVPTAAPADREERYEPLPVPLDEPAEDIVTLASVLPPATTAATAPTASAAAPSAAMPATAGSETAGPPALAGSAERPAPARSIGAAVATLIGIVGLAAAAASLWLVFDRQSAVERLTARLDAVDRQLARPEPAAPAPLDPALQDLDGRVRGLAQRIDATLAAERGSDPALARSLDAVGERLSHIEKSVAELKSPAAAQLPALPAPAAPTPPPAAAAPTPPPAPAAAPPPKPAAPAVSADAAAAKKPAAAPAPKPVKKPLPEPGQGPWTLIIESFASDRDAERRQATLEKSGIPAEIRQVEIEGQVWHRVVVSGYESQEAAKTVAADLRARKIGSPWVVRSSD